MRATVEATPNIALVKYWGKRDDRLMLPMNGSISITLDEAVLTRTTVVFDSFEKDEIILNGKHLSGMELDEGLKVINAVRARAGTKKKAKVASVNCFPTAAGMASSASGFAALAIAAADAAGLSLTAKELSIIARLGSGSASRSVIGGFVEWLRGSKANGSDSFAQQIRPANHWPEIVDMIAVVDPSKKKIGSRPGMKLTAKTSRLYPERVRTTPAVLKKVRAAIVEKDLETMLTETMKDSNNLHAVMLDTWPPILYLNDTSRDIINEMHKLNQAGTIAGYTFDAGPNAHIITTKKYIPEVEHVLKGIEGIQKIIVAGVGNGPKHIISEREHLLEIDGHPREYHVDNGRVIVK